MMDSENTTLKVFGGLKLVRVLRLSKIIVYLTVTQETKAVLKVFKLMFMLALYMHCLACIWWKIVSGNEYWIPPMNFNDDDFYFVYK